MTKMEFNLFAGLTVSSNDKVTERVNNACQAVAGQFSFKSKGSKSAVNVTGKATLIPVQSGTWQGPVSVVADFIGWNEALRQTAETFGDFEVTGVPAKFNDWLAKIEGAVAQEAAEAAAKK